MKESIKKNKSWNDFKVVLLGVIYNPKTKRILLGKKNKDAYIPNLTWCFPGGKLNYKEKLDKILKRKIKEQTGLIVKNLGSIFSDKDPVKNELLEIYFLCESIGGKEKAGDDLLEIKWVNPDEVYEYFTSPFNTRLKEYLMNLK